MTFKIDENLPDALVPLLADRGHQACTARQQALNGRRDVALMAACRSERRTIVTLDLDFADINVQSYIQEERVMAHLTNWIGIDDHGLELASAMSHFLRRRSATKSRRSGGSVRQGCVIGTLCV